MSQRFSRRDVMRGGALIAVGLAAPTWLSTLARAEVVRQAKGQSGRSDTVLVVCQLSGGNDGLNTLVPYADPAYYRLRPTVGIPERDVLKLDESVGFHPALAGLAELYREKKVAVVGNVGYPNPNRSHFKSMEIWQSASPEGNLRHGWLGRSLDQMAQAARLNPVVALGLSTDKPLSLAGERVSVPCFASLADIQNMVGDADAERMLREIQGTPAPEGSPLRAVQLANQSALDAMSTLRDQIKGFAPKQTYANDAFGSGFKQIAQLICTSPNLRMIYFSAGGFDTHARQPDQHAKLLKGFGDAMLAFQRELQEAGKADNVVTLAFSEFGRRVEENASQGTDHGAAGPMFLVGNRVKPGLHGAKPDLQNLANGDLAFKTDFREVYAATLDEWMGIDSGIVLGRKFEHADVFAA